MWWWRGRRFGRRGRGFGPRPRPWCFWYNWYYYQNQYYGSWGGYGYANWNYGWRWQQSTSQYQTTPTQQRWGSGDIKQKAKEILSSAVLGQNMGGPFGAANIPIIYNGVVVGWLWENVPLGDLEIGNYWYTGAGTRIALLYKGRIVGFLWV